MSPLGMLKNRLDLVLTGFAALKVRSSTCNVNVKNGTQPMTRTNVVISVVCRSVNCQQGDWDVIYVIYNIWACFSNKNQGYIPIKGHPFSPFMVISTPIGRFRVVILNPRRQQVWAAKKKKKKTDIFESFGDESGVDITQSSHGPAVAPPQD